jgi:hypothetical protein
MAEAKKTKKSGPAKTKNGPAEKKAGATQPSLIDTSLAAATAARMVGSHTTQAASGGEHSESAAFKKLKEGLTKPSTQGLSSFISGGAPSKKTGTPFGVQNQMKRGQTFGADVNRTGVPRRTGG